MVWHKVGKFGVHSGRTLRSPSKPQRASPHSRAGYITKIVVNRTKPLDTDEIKRQLDNFRIADGFQNDLVVSETRFRNFEEEELWGRGFQSYDMVLSLNKKKRWLLPRLLREKITEDKEAFESEPPLDPRVVLIERKSANIQDPDSFLRRLKNGDCHDVIDSSDKSCSLKRNSSRKRRKLCHVGDKYKRSEETVITYELCDNLAANSWPNYKETRSNSARLDFWYGDFRKRENKLKKMKMSKFCATDFDDLDVDYDFDDYEDDVDENLMKQSRHEFGLEAYVVDDASTKLSCKKHARKKYKSKAKPNQKVTENINPASSEKVHYYGKGFAKFIDPPDQDDESNNKEMTINPSTSPAPPMNLELESHTLVKRFELSILTDSLNIEDLQEKLKSRFKEGESIPRKFFISAPFCHHQYLLLEPCDSGKTNDNVSCKVRVTFICDDRQNVYPCESDPYTITNTCNELAQLENQNEVLSINEVVDIFDSSCTCCKASEKKSESKMQKSRMRKTVVAFDVFNSFNGHKTEVSSLMEASKEISAQCQNLNEAVAKNYDCSSLDCTKYPKTCEICFTESNESDEGFTALIACNHWFCNDCWRTYLVAQLQLGKAIVSCPATDCGEVVDDATFMSLASKSYFKYKNIQQERAFELSKEWKWCPGDKCQLVAKITNTESLGISMEEPDNKQTTRLPCICTCSQIWCFGCQEDPHWPASCDQARTFRNRTKMYQELAVSSGEDRVTSVSVRRCPNCAYPVEKDGGCPHMVCTKCNGEFCWTCLSAWGVHDCQADAISEDVELTDTIGNARFNKHVKISTFHKKARKVEHLFKMYKAVEDVLNAVDSYDKLQQQFGSNWKFPSRTQAFLASCYQNDIPKKLKLMVDIKFISHSVIEGASIHMATSKTKQGHRKLQRLTNNLYFVIVRLEHYLSMKMEDLCLVLDQALALVESAKALIFAIGQVVHK